MGTRFVRFIILEEVHGIPPKLRKISHKSLHLNSHTPLHFPQRLLIDIHKPDPGNEHKQFDDKYNGDMQENCTSVLPHHDHNASLKNPTYNEKGGYNAS